MNSKQSIHQHKSINTWENQLRNSKKESTTTIQEPHVLRNTEKQQRKEKTKKTREEQTLVLTFTEETFQNFKANWVVINSKNTHTNWKLVCAAIFTTGNTQLVFHSHCELHSSKTQMWNGSKSRGKTEITRKKKETFLSVENNSTSVLWSFTTTQMGNKNRNKKNNTRWITDNQKKTLREEDEVSKSCGSEWWL